MAQWTKALSSVRERYAVRFPPESKVMFDDVNFRQWCGFTIQGVSQKTPPKLNAYKSHHYLLKSKIFTGMSSMTNYMYVSIAIQFHKVV